MNLQSFVNRGYGACRRQRDLSLRYHCATSAILDDAALRCGMNSIHRAAGYVTLSSEITIHAFRKELCICQGRFRTSAFSMTLR